ncbi:MAG: HisA/HisF-related TIM barrel protein [Planctomycetales bacterium]
MQVIPVLDLMNGVVVRGIAGRREDYLPVRSALVDGARPLDIARAFRDQLGLLRLYVADLDGILDELPNWDVYGLLLADGFELCVDAGVRDLGLLRRLFKNGVTQVVLGSETVSSMELVQRAVREFGSGRLIYSLDLKQGKLMGEAGEEEPLQRVEKVCEAGIRELIVLDVAYVGVGSGVRTVELCREIHERFPEMKLITGGGIRDEADLLRLKEEPIAGVLVASALHDERIGVEGIQRCE